MLDRLSQRFGEVFDKLRSRGLLSHADVASALREVRIALLEADVALSVVKSFVEEVQTQATGQKVLESVAPGQMVVKIVHDHLVALLHHPQSSPLLKGSSPVVWLCVGLQGSGKTTMTAKLALLLKQKEKRKVMMASLDVYRPAAQKQLAILGEKIAVETLPIVVGELPADIAKRALKLAQRQGVDVLLLDTAGRLHIDIPLMEEAAHIKELTSPLETLLVADAMIGQDAVHMAKAFHEKVGVTGIALSRMDGDTRGGALLSMRAVTGQPIKFLGLGESPHQCEPFQAERVAGRILGMGDIVGLVERAQSAFSDVDAQTATARLEKGIFLLDDLADHLKKIKNAGGLGSLLALIPGGRALKEKALSASGGDQGICQKLAILSSMTLLEKRTPKILNVSRKQRIAQGSGTSVVAVNQLLKQYHHMSQAVKKMKKAGIKGWLKNQMSKGF